MALSAPRVIFGIHNVAPYNRSTGEFYGTLRVLGGSSLSLSGELIKLNGGSAKYPWAVEDGLVQAEMNWKIREYPSFLFELFLGKAPTDNSADTAGTTSTLTNQYGSSVVNATTGIATVAVIPTTGAANTKFGKYIVKAASATTVDIFMSTDIDHLHGTDEEFDNDYLRVATAQTISSGANTDIASLGIRFAGGSGAIALTTGDTAQFTVRPPTSKSMNVVIGATTDIFPEFGALVYAKKKVLSSTTGEYTEIDVFRCKGIGLPLGFEENAFSEAEVKIEAFYDSDPVFSATAGVFEIRHATTS